MLLLPYLGEDDLFHAFRLDEPWDSPHNRALLPRMPSVYAPPPGFEGPCGPGPTCCQTVAGGGAYFETEGYQVATPFWPAKNDTAALVEAGDPVPWTQPKDVVHRHIDPLPRLGAFFRSDGDRQLLSLFRKDGFHIATGDGLVRFVDAEVSEAAVRDMIDAPRLLGSNWYLRTPAV